MNREEAMKIIKENRPNYRDWQEEFDEALDRLKQPITLAEFLGWEEGKEYRRGGNILKVEANHLLDKRPNGQFSNTYCTTAELIDLRNATKYEPLYYAKIKGWQLIPSDYCYFGLDDNHNLEIKDACDAYEFTKAEWAKLEITDENAEGQCGGIHRMTKKELQAQINFLVSELEHLRNGYNKLSDEAFNDRMNKNKFYEMWRKADEKAERYGGLLVTLHELIQPHYTGEDVDLSAIRKLIDDWYESLEELEKVSV